MENFLFDQLFLLLGQLHLIHLSHKLVPRLFTFSLLIFGLGILVFDICFRAGSFFLCSTASLNLCRLIGLRCACGSSILSRVLRLTGLASALSLANFWHHFDSNEHQNSIKIKTWHQNANKNRSRKSLFLNVLGYARNQPEST